MSTPVSSVSPTPAPAPPTSNSTRKPSQAETAPATPKDTVQLSTGAQALAAAALQEVRETPTQTAQEANQGDLQAKRLLASEAAAHPTTR
jgi:hypothetical protein